MSLMYFIVGSILLFCLYMIAKPSSNKRQNKKPVKNQRVNRPVNSRTAINASAVKLNGHHKWMTAQNVYTESTTCYCIKNVSYDTVTFHAEGTDFIRTLPREVFLEMYVPFEKNRK